MSLALHSNYRASCKTVQEKHIGVPQRSLTARRHGSVTEVRVKCNHFRLRHPCTNAVTSWSPTSLLKDTSTVSSSGHRSARASTAWAGTLALHTTSLRSRGQCWAMASIADPASMQ
jgi:hypothetical protein